MDFTIRISIEFSGPVVVWRHSYNHLPICPIWAKSLSHLIFVGRWNWIMRISGAAGQIYCIWSSLELAKLLVVQWYSFLPIWPIWGCWWTRTHIYGSAGQISAVWSSMELSRIVVAQHHVIHPFVYLSECESLKLLVVFLWFELYGIVLTRSCAEFVRSSPLCHIWACPWARAHIIWNHRRHFFGLKFCGSV